MQSRLLFVLIIFACDLFVGINGYGCRCSCCTGSGCSLTYLGSISVTTCASTSCVDACKAMYTSCSIGSINAVCNANQFYRFYSILCLICLSILLSKIFV